MRGQLAGLIVLVFGASAAVAGDWYILDVKNPKALSCQKSDSPITPPVARQAGAKVEELPGVAPGVYVIEFDGGTIYMAETEEKCQTLKKTVANFLKSK